MTKSKKTTAEVSTRRLLTDGPARAQLQCVFSSLFHSGNNADCAFKAEDSSTVHHLHRAVLCEQSPVFAAMLSTGYSEGQNADVPIVLKAVSEDVVRVGLGYMYGISLSPELDLQFAVDL